jgi:hypothetical protein
VEHGHFTCLTLVVDKSEFAMEAVRDSELDFIGEDVALLIQSNASAKSHDRK